MVGGKRHLLQIQRIAQALGRRGGLRLIAQPDVAQPALRAQRLQPLARRLRQGRQLLDQRHQRRQVQAIAGQFPATLVAVLLQAQACLAPARAVEGDRQRIHQQAPPARTGLEIAAEIEFLQAHRRAIGVAELRQWQVQAHHGALQGALGPLRPDFATAQQALQMPVAQQAVRQPTRPVALWQTQVEIAAGLLPAAGPQAQVQVQGQRLAVRQQQTAIQPVPVAPLEVEIEVQVGEIQGRAFARLHDELAVDHRDPREAPQLTQPVGGIRFAPRLALGQAGQRPAPLRVLAQQQLHAPEFQRVETRLPVPQAAQQIGAQAQLIDAQPGFFAEADVACDQLRQEAVHACAQTADAQRRAQRLAGAPLQRLAIVAQQRRQFAPQADVQGGQHQPRRQQAEAQAQQGIEQTQR